MRSDEYNRNDNLGLRLRDLTAVIEIKEVIDAHFILKASTDIYGTLGEKDWEQACKRSAQKMSQWFISTRYPLFLMSLDLLVSL